MGSHDRSQWSSVAQKISNNAKQAIDAGMIKVVSGKGVSDRAKEVTELANSLFRYGKHDVKLIHGGESESIALMEKQGIQTLRFP